jgi:hypothetical protein
MGCVNSGASLLSVYGLFVKNSFGPPNGELYPVWEAKKLPRLGDLRTFQPVVDYFKAAG